MCSTPDGFVISTFEAHSVRDFIHAAFNAVDIPVESNGKKGTEEEYVRTDTGEIVVKINPDFYRPAEVDFLLGDNTKAKTLLKWNPKISFEDLVRIMTEYDLEKEAKNGN
jgi:GDPmannose 4,6-dehydratase